MNDVRRHQSPEATEAFGLIAAGRLPPAAGISPVSDEPLWGLSAIADVVGIDLANLLDHLRQGPPRFQVTAPKGGPGDYRMLAK